MLQTGSLVINDFLSLLVNRLANSVPSNASSFPEFEKYLIQFEFGA